MRSITQPVRTFLPACLCLAAVVAVDWVATSAVAQERRSDDDNDRRRDPGERRGGGWWSGRRDRDERRDDRADDRRENSADRESSEAASEDANFTTQNWAKSLVKKHDKNGNSMLDGDEREAAGRQAALADANKDNVITIDELVAQAGGKPMSAASTATAAAKPADESSKAASADRERNSNDTDRDSRDRRDRGAVSGSGASSGTKSSTPSRRVFTWMGNSGSSNGEMKTDRRTYRFTPARERLPNELPSWFKSQDKNGDGQVSMSEYARSWTKSTVAKFQGYDTDGDGIVTAKEVKGRK